MQLDIVNEKDEVLGQGEVEEIHKKKLLHRSVHIFIIDSKERFYVRQRKPDSPRYPAWWTTSIGVHVPLGSTYEQTAKAALKEKMGFDFPLTYVDKMVVHDEYEDEISYLYVGHIGDGEEIKANPLEPGKFFTVEDLQNLPNHAKVTPYVLKSLGLYLQRHTS